MFKSLYKLSFLVSLCALVWSAASSNAVAEDKFITIGTGSVTGVYYPAGGAICRLVNRGRRDHGIRCSVESTGGSEYNINSLRSGELDIGVAQSDVQYHAVHGTGPESFKNAGPYEELRALFSLHSEPFTVIARADAGVKVFNDLKGKRVNIGNPGSGTRNNMDMIMSAKGWEKRDFKLAAELKASEQAQALCDDKIDVMIFSAGHPNGATQEVTTSCDAIIVPVDDEDIQKMVDQYPFYAFTTIPGGMYRGNDDNVRTFGVKATFVSSSKVEEEVIYRVVKSVFDNFDNFKTLHPVFATLQKDRLVKEGNSAPLHDGAARYFKEVGLLK